MARYIGPKTKIARKFGVAIYGDDKSFEKRRNQPPGQHGPNKRRGAKKSEYAVQLAEKQKVKYTKHVLLLVLAINLLVDFQSFVQKKYE